MSRNERNGGWRDQTYSAWHRALPFELDFLDIDWIEVCHVCKRIVAVYELCADIEQVQKVTYQTRVVAERLGVVGFAVLYEGSGDTISRFRIRRITDPVTAWKWVTPGAWMRQLLALRTCHPVAASPTFMPSAAEAFDSPDFLAAFDKALGKSA